MVDSEVTRGNPVVILSVFPPEGAADDRMLCSFTLTDEQTRAISDSYGISMGEYAPHVLDGGEHMIVASVGSVSSTESTVIRSWDEIFTALSAYAGADGNWHIMNNPQRDYFQSVRSYVEAISPVFENSQEEIRAIREDEMFCLHIRKSFGTKAQIIAAPDMAALQRMASLFIDEVSI